MRKETLGIKKWQFRVLETNWPELPADDVFPPPSHAYLQELAVRGAILSIRYSPEFMAAQLEREEQRRIYKVSQESQFLTG